MAGCAAPNPIWNRSLERIIACCAVGPVGGKAHSPDEFLNIDSLVPRAQAVARAILRLDAAGL
jgi:acetylornithine deacetylase/succinyl-diaminopimelate desuccinylase-like protein